MHTKYYSGDQIEKNETDRACSIRGRGEEYRGLLWGKPEGRRSLGRPRRRWEDNIEMDLQEVGWGHELNRSGSV
jgi:hypothetical protein